MKKCFYKYQWIVVLLALLNVGYNYKLNHNFSSTLNSGKSDLYKIVDKNCHSHRINSTISIYYNNTKYFIVVSSEDCNNFKINSEIPLFYDNINDEFLIKKYTSKKGNLIMSLTLLLFTILPLQFFSKIMNR